MPRADDILKPPAARSAFRRAFPLNVTRRSPARNTLLLSCWPMSFQDDAVEPLAIESAQHFTELLRRAGAGDAGDAGDAGEAQKAGKAAERCAEERERWQRREPRRALPRDLGN